MVATKTTKPAKDGTPSAYTQGMATESAAVALTPYVYIAEPAGETLITPALDSTVAGTVTTQGTALSGVKGQMVMGSVTTAAPTYVNGNINPLNLDTTGALRVNAGTVAGIFAQNATTSGQLTGLVSGAVTTAAPTYTTAQTSPLSLDTAGNLRVNVTTLSGNAAQGSTTAGQLTQLGSGAVTTGAPSYSTGQTSPLSLDLAGNLRASVSGSVTSLSSNAITNPTSTLTRPANTTAYVANDLIGSSVTAGSVVSPVFAIASSGGGAILSSLILRTNATTGWDAVNLSINLWRAQPTYTNGDNGVYAVATGSANWIANVLVTLSQFGDGAVGRGSISNANEVALNLASGTSVFWDIQILTAATPISGQTFILTADLLN